MFILSPYLHSSGNYNTKTIAQEIEPISESSISDKPIAKEIVNRLIMRNQSNTHPRLMATNQDFDRIKSQINTDEKLMKNYSYIKAKADSILTQEPVIYELPDGVRLLSISRKVLERIQILSFVYKISGDSTYADRAWLELETISGRNPDQEKFAFPDWHPAHFLDTAEMTNAASIGYDWLYDYLSTEQKAIIRDAIYERGLKQAIPLYRKNTSWVKASHNWNGVCNGGIGMGALAIADEGRDFETLSGEILESAIKSLPLMLKQYNPDGGWFEGPGYWDYGTTYASYFMSSLDSCLGTDYGLSKVPGFSLAGDFPLYMAGPKGTFNFADAHAGTINSPTLLYLANKFNKPEYMWYFNKKYNPKNGNVMSFIWSNPNISETKPTLQNKYFRTLEAVAMHSDLLNSKEMFVGFKAGTNGLNHGDLDIGSFVFDLDGIRWFDDIGSENYNLPGYFQMGKTGKRWDYYRKRAESHNTLVINPSSKPDQNPIAKTKIELFKDNVTNTFAVADITNAYKGDASSVKRGIKMNRDSQLITIQDEITTINPSEIWWFANTQASIELTDDKKAAILTKQNKKVKVQISSPDNACFDVMDAIPLASSPNPQKQTPNSEQKLAIHLTDTTNAVICVVISPITSDDYTSTEIHELIPLDEWQ
jgi:hypothetical protein